MHAAVIEGVVDFNKMRSVNFYKAYILVQVLIVYLDGNTGIYMILKLNIGGKLLTV